MKTVAIIGTGLLGRGIAKVVVRAGYPVILHDANPATLAGAQEDVVAVAHAAGVAVQAQADLALAVRDAGLVIEAVIENLQLKQDLFERMAAANPDAILMSNSSVLPISQIAARATYPQRTVGTHWWNPPDLIPIVEVIRGPHSSDAVVNETAQFLQSLGKTVVRVERDVPGFVGNRMQHALWREALALVSDGTCAAEQVDQLVAVTLGQTLAQRGPVAEMQRMGIARVEQEFASALPLLNSDPTPAALLRKKVQAGQLGAKSGQGFLTWPSGAREQAAQRLQRHVEQRVKSQALPAEQVATLSADQEIIARRLRVAIWREALAMINTGVCDAATVDVAATQTIGLRLAAMGPVENADYVGLDLTIAIHQAVFPSLNACHELSRDWLDALRPATR